MLCFFPRALPSSRDLLHLRKLQDMSKDTALLEFVPFRRQGRRDALLKKATSLRAGIAEGGYRSHAPLSAGDS